MRNENEVVLGRETFIDMADSASCEEVIYPESPVESPPLRERMGDDHGFPVSRLANVFEIGEQRLMLSRFYLRRWPRSHRFVSR